MYFGANTFIWESPFSTRATSLFDHVKDLGFDAIEIAVEDPTLIEPLKAKDELQRTGLRGLICGAFPADRDISSDNPRIRENAKDYLRFCIDAAQQIASPVVLGPMYACVGKARLLSPPEHEAEWKRSVEGLREMCDYAGERNVRLAFEPLNRFETSIINVVGQGLELIADVGQPNLGFHIDTFHMHLEEKNSGDAIRAAGDRVFHVHASENDRGVPGTGQVHWTEVAQALADIHYDGGVVIESFTPEVKSIAQAVAMWRPIAPSQDAIAADGLRFLKALFSGRRGSIA